MATDEVKTTETLAEGNGSSISSDPAKSQALAGSGSDEGGVKVSAANNEGLNGEIGGDNGGVVILTSRIVETEVSIETSFGGEDKAVLGDENEMGDGLDSALGVGNDEGNGVQKIRSERDSSVLNGDGSDKKVEYNGDGISLVVEVHGSSGGANETEKIIGCDDDDDNNDDKGSLAENGKFTEITGSMSKEGEIQDVTEDKRNEDVNANKEDEDEEEEEEEDDDDDDVGDENHEYLVGDFVWGKIRSHPWWPGQIYNPSDASAYAAKYKRKDRLLVAYFGDGSFSWCKPSQLKPFAENYVEMSKQSNSKGFVNAVQMALDEISRIVELEMTCRCTAEENRIRVSGPVVNGGIRAGVLVPGGSTGKQLISLHEPEKLIASVSCLARVISISNLLEFTVLKSWLTAFYRAKGGYQLANYHEPKCIEGLEDKNRNGVLDTTDFSDPVEVPIEEDWVSSPVDPGLVKCNQLVSQKGPEISEDKLYQRRKQKSVAELMKEEMDVEPKHKKGGSIVKGTASGKKKRMANDETESEDNSVLTPPSGGKKRGRKKKAEVSGSPKTTENKASSVENGNVRGEVANASPLTRGKKQNKGSSVENGDGRTKEETVKRSESRGKKRNKGSSVENGDGRMKEETVKSSESRGKKRNKVSSDENHDGRTKEETVKSSELRGKKRNKVSSAGNDDSSTKEETLKSIVARERKKSRYLSPPYTDLITWRIRNSNSKRDSEADSEKNSNITRMGERMTRAAGKLIGSPTVLKSSGKTVENKVPKELGGGEETSETAKQDNKQNINSMEVDANPNEVLSEIKSAALDPLYLREKRDLDMIIGFIFGFRSSVFLNGSNYKVYHKRHSGRKRKLITESQQTGNELNEPMPKLKKNDKEAETKASSSVALVLTFPPAFSLPSKNDLIKIFTKFGALSETETDVFYNSYSARVVFVKSSDAEEAFNVSMEKSPFGTANVNFRLRYSAREKASSPISKAPEIPLGFVREKLEMITSMLENSGGRISSQMKSTLQGEMKGLLEKVSAMESTSS